MAPLADADSLESVVRGRGTSGQDPGLMLPAFFGGCSQMYKVWDTAHAVRRPW
jgi:hypothetical protein